MSRTISGCASRSIERDENVVWTLTSLKRRGRRSRVEEEGATRSEVKVEVQQRCLDRRVNTWHGINDCMRVPISPATDGSWECTSDGGDVGLEHRSDEDGGSDHELLAAIPDREVVGELLDEGSDDGGSPGRGGVEEGVPVREEGISDGDGDAGGVGG